MPWLEKHEPGIWKKEDGDHPKAYFDVSLPWLNCKGVFLNVFAKKKFNTDAFWDTKQGLEMCTRPLKRPLFEPALSKYNVHKL